MEKLTLLLDGDVFAFQAAVTSQSTVKWDDETVTVEGDLVKAREKFDDRIRYIKEKLNGTHVIIALSDIGTGYWRRDVLPSYKMNRAGSAKPIMLRDIREYVMANYYCKVKDKLEGDDVLGILATHPTLVPGKKYIVSEDKDMKTIPCTFARIDRKNQTIDIQKIDEQTANFWHMYQTLTGDTTDGYKGCPKVGPKGAVKLLEPLLVNDEKVPLGPKSMWTVVVAAYQKAGLTEADALIQARVARILRHTDYDFKTKQPILWTPPVITKKGEDESTGSTTGSSNAGGQAGTV